MQTGIKNLSLVPFLLILCAIFLFACGDSEKVDSKELAMALNQPKNDLTKESDERFMVSAAEFAYKEILAGKLAQQRSSSQSVRDLAKSMEDSYREFKSSLGSMGIIKGIAVPSTP